MANAPHYALERIKDLVLLGRRHITATAANGAAELGFDEDDIENCVQGLSPQDFHKTMPSETRPGTWQDVYRATWSGVPVYVKLQLAGRSEKEQAVVISFKRK
jgi:motility quorum-sensing regulator / GCU-specific mRNA interferase toxin